MCSKGYDFSPQVPIDDPNILNVSLSDGKLVRVYDELDPGYIGTVTLSDFKVRATDPESQYNREVVAFQDPTTIVEALLDYTKLRFVNRSKSDGVKYSLGQAEMPNVLFNSKKKKPTYNKNSRKLRTILLTNLTKNPSEGDFKYGLIPLERNARIKYSEEEIERLNHQLNFKYDQPTLDRVKDAYIADLKCSIPVDEWDNPIVSLLAPPTDKIFAENSYFAEFKSGYEDRDDIRYVPQIIFKRYENYYELSDVEKELYLLLDQQVNNYFGFFFDTPINQLKINPIALAETVYGDVLCPKAVDLYNDLQDSPALSQITWMDTHPEYFKVKEKLVRFNEHNIIPIEYMTPRQQEMTAMLYDIILRSTGYYESQLNLQGLQGLQNNPRIHLQLDNQGIYKWDALRVVGNKKEMEWVTGEIGQFFFPNDQGIITAKFNGQPEQQYFFKYQQYFFKHQQYFLKYKFNQPDLNSLISGYDVVCRKAIDEMLCQINVKSHKLGSSKKMLDPITGQEYELRTISTFDGSTRINQIYHDSWLPIQ